MAAPALARAPGGARERLPSAPSSDARATERSASEFPSPSGRVEVRCEFPPASPFRLPRLLGMDGMLRRRGGVLERLLHHEGEPVVVRVAQPGSGAGAAVLVGSRARTRAGALHGIERMCFALGVEEDLRPFLERFRRDPLIGRSVARRPWLRVTRRPDPFEALVLAICEQLIEYERAAAIERRLLARIGRRGAGWDGAHGAALCDMPTPATLAGTAPALLQSFDLAGARAITMVKAARAVAGGRIDLLSGEHERAWRALRAIPGIGSWTVEMLALHGQGRHDQLPTGDLGLLKLVGRALGGGDPRAIASEQQVRDFFAPYEEWAGLAAAHMLGS